MLVVEQDYHIGGTAHVFRRRGFTFPAGPISVTEPNYITRFLYWLGVISVPLDQLEKQLSDSFPQERKGIIEVFEILNEVIYALDVLQPEDLIENDPCCITDIAARALIERWGVYLPVIYLKGTCRMKN